MTKTTVPFEPIEQSCINALRCLALDMIDQADSGHPGLPLGAAPLAHVLWSRHLRHNPADPAWPDRDRFVLSAGHGSALLYALLHLYGYALPLAELRRFRQWGSRAPGHPERGETPGVEVTTGPLGQGLANAVGMAMAERFLAARFAPLVDHYTYVLAGDGDLMEGVAAEAVSLAGHLRLGRLVCLYDSNGISLAASTRLSFTEDVAGRFAACGWQVLTVTDGNDLAAIDAALTAAKAETERPTLIVVQTHIGFASPKQDSCEAHGAPLGAAASAATKRALGWPDAPTFHVPEEVRQHLQGVAHAGAREQERWQQGYQRFRSTSPAEAAVWDAWQQGRLPDGWDRELPHYPATAKALATRSAGGEVMNLLARQVGNLFGGSADLDPSTKTALKGRGSFQPLPAPEARVEGADPGGWGYGGANIAFGVREHAMGAMLNGMAAHGGVVPFGATFFVFADYLRPALRLAALARHKVIHIFTHDSIAVGEDGPTHQPVEQLASLRAIPGLITLRPADANETVAAWRVAITHRDGPVALVLSRQNLPILDRSGLGASDEVVRGAYVLYESGGPPAVLLIATGAEVHPALEACRRLAAAGTAVRLVSMPSWELFAAQPASYREQVLPTALRRRLAVEAGSSFGWCRWVGSEGRCLCIDRFGASAPGEENLARFGFSVEHILEQVRELLRG